MAITKIDGFGQIQPDTITDLNIASGAGIATFKLNEGAEFLKRNGSVAMAGNLNLNNNTKLLT